MLLLYYTMQRLLGCYPVPHRREKTVTLCHTKWTGLLSCTQRGLGCYLVPYKADCSAFLYTEGTRLLSCAKQSGLLLSCIIHSEQGIILYNTEGTDQLLSCTIQRGLSL